MLCFDTIDDLTAAIMSIEKEFAHATDFTVTAVSSFAINHTASKCIVRLVLVSIMAET